MGGSRDEVRASLTVIFEQHNPRKVDDIDSLLSEWAGHEDQLLAAVKGKYASRAIQNTPAESGPTAAGSVQLSCRRAGSRLHVNVIQVKDLPSAEGLLGGRNDPYVAIFVDGHEAARTSTLENTGAEGTWNQGAGESLSVDLTEKPSAAGEFSALVTSEPKITVSVFDEDKHGWLPGNKLCV